MSLKKARKGGRFRAPIFVVTHFVTQLFVTVGIEANDFEKKLLFKALFGTRPSHLESPVTETYNAQIVTNNTISLSADAA